MKAGHLSLGVPPAEARRLAIISCVHGNLEALEAVLADLEKRAVDSVVCLGDLVGYGPFPDETVARIRECRVPTVLGCWDEGIAQDNEDCGCKFVSEEEGVLGAMAFWWTATQVSNETKALLGKLPMALAFDLPCGRLVAVHGSPASTSEYLTESTHELVMLERVARAGCDSLAEETGLHDRITSALDPWLRHVGLSGRDLVPVLTGFGCNVVAVLQSRACSSCSRSSCASLIAFGSACSYQIGASLSLFGSAGRPWMFAPYLSVVFVVGLLHTKLWHGSLAPGAALPLHERAYLQAPSARAIAWRVAVVVKQFLLLAMPIFLLLCLSSAILEYSGAMAAVGRLLAPAMHLFHLPSEVALSVVLSVFRKDGVLLLNASDGALLRSLSAGQLFVVVYLASTLTACLVTLWTVRREMGWRVAGKLAGRQALTSILTTWVIAHVAA